MKRKSLFAVFLLLIICMLSFSACVNDSLDDPYKNYTASGLKAKIMPVDFEKETFGYNKVELISDYEKYTGYGLNWGYTAAYFELNDLLIFGVKGCSSDGMVFGEILENEKVLYPLFYRKKIADNQPVTDDIVLQSYCVEIPKGSAYKSGEIVFRYK